MRISCPEWSKWAVKSAKCLNIGTHCALCARSGAHEIDLCAACELQFRTCAAFINRLGASSSLCLECGIDEFAVRPMAGQFSHGEHYCDECVRRSGRLLARIVAPYRYAHPVDHLIKRIKYREERQLARVLGTLLGKAVQHSGDRARPQVLLPMPIHASRLKHRGFNQAQDIAHWVGKYTNLPVATGLLSRVVDTGSLAGLNRQERQHRILGAFRASDSLVGKHVAIVDDVLTTGASARELAREIYDSGADSVELWVLARTSSLRSGV